MAVREDQEWANDPSLRRTLREEILADYRANVPSGNLLIDKNGLDEWLPNISPPMMKSPVAARERNPVGRPRTTRGYLGQLFGHVLGSQMGVPEQLPHVSMPADQGDLWNA